MYTNSQSHQILFKFLIVRYSNYSESVLTVLCLCHLLQLPHVEGLEMAAENQPDKKTINAYWLRRERV